MKSFINALTVLIFLPLSLLSQETEELSYKEKAEQYVLTSKYDSALYMFQLARNEALDTKDSTEYFVLSTRIVDELMKMGQIQKAQETATNIMTEGRSHLEGLNMAKAYRAIGNVYSRGLRNYDQALAYFDSAQQIINEVEGPESLRQQATIFNDIGVVNYLINDITGAEKYFKAALEVASGLEKTEQVANMMGFLSNNIGGMLKIRQAYNEAIDYHRKAIEVASKYMKDPSGVLSIAYDGIASSIVESRELSSEKALIYYQQALKLFQLQGDTHDPVYTYMGMGIVYANLGEDDKALESLLKATELSERHLGLYHEKSILSYISLADQYRRMERLDEAFPYYETSLRILKELNYEVSQPSLQAHEEIAHIHFQQGRKALGFQYIEKAKSILKLLYGDAQRAVISYLTITDIFRYADELDSAMVYVDKSLEMLEGKGEDITEILFNALRLKVSILEEKYREDNKTEYLTEAFDGILKGDSLIASIRGSATMLRDRIANQEDYSEWYIRGIRIAKELTESLEDTSYVRKAWVLNEANKGTLLLSNIDDSRDSDNLNVPIELLAMDGDLMNSIGHFESLKYAAIQSNDSTQLASLDAQLFEYRQKQDSLRDIIKRDYPFYYFTKYDFQFQTIEGLQSQLTDGELVLNYHVGDSSVYLFEVDKYDFRLTDLKLDSAFYDDFHELIRSLQDPLDLNSSPQKLQDISYHISQTILPEAVRDKKYSRLIVIPEGDFTRIPFDLLPLTRQEDVTVYSQIDYLIKDYEVSYANSTTLLNLQESGRSKATNSILALAPVFDMDDMANNAAYDTIKSDLKPLVFSEQEVDQLAAFFDTRRLKRNEANEKVFKQLSDQHSIIHIASHAIMNADPLFSKLVFSPENLDSLNDGFLYTQELFNMNIHAEMVVLSACNTGSGDIISGEGIISLANGFFYAGSKSLIMSLWTANDQSTASIVGDFYAELAAEKNKSTALRNAKLKYLENADELRSHPYYWAHLVVNGNNQPIPPDDNLGRNFYLLVIFGACLIILAARRKKAKR